MLEFVERVVEVVPHQAELTLPFSQRQKTRFRAELDDGTSVNVVLPRGKSLRDGDCLRAATGEVVCVRAAVESISRVVSNDAHLLCRVAYHLGNRHVPVELAAGALAYQHDHVLDDMVRGLGLNPEAAVAPFEPESGAYGSGHAHTGGHGAGAGKIHVHEVGPVERGHQH